jgi:hypothetical protein
VNDASLAMGLNLKTIQRAGSMAALLFQDSDESQQQKFSRVIFDDNEPDNLNTRNEADIVCTKSTFLIY